MRANVFLDDALAQALEQWIRASLPRPARLPPTWRIPRCSMNRGARWTGCRNCCRSAACYPFQRDRWAERAAAGCPYPVRCQRRIRGSTEPGRHPRGPDAPARPTAVGAGSRMARTSETGIQAAIRTSLQGSRDTPKSRTRTTNPSKRTSSGPRSKYRSIQSHCFAPDSSLAHARNGVSLQGCAIEATSLPPGASTSWIDRSTLGMSGMSCSARQKSPCRRTPRQGTRAIWRHRRSGIECRAALRIPTSAHERACLATSRAAVTTAPRRAISRAK